MGNQRDDADGMDDERRLVIQDAVSKVCRAGPNGLSSTYIGRVVVGASGISRRV
jgi:hypothetical protein